MLNFQIRLTLSAKAAHIKSAYLWFGEGKDRATFFSLSFDIYIMYNFNHSNVQTKHN